MAESRGMLIFRSSDTSILIRAVLFDGTNAKITSGTTSLRIWHVIPTSGALETYDFNDNTFKAGAVTTPTVAMTHRQAENNTYNTGFWDYRHTTLGVFTVGDKYLFEISHASLPRVITTEYQYGDSEGDSTSLSAGAVWDENIVAAHGTASTAGLLLRVLGAAISTRANNGTLNALLGVPDTASSNIAETVWDEPISGHVTANTTGAALEALGTAIDNRTNNSNLNALLGVPDTASLNIADVIWEEDIVSAHGTTSSAGLLLRVLGALISTRTNNATLNALLGVPDTAGATVPSRTTDEVWDENIVAAHGTASTAGLLLRVLGADISTRTNNATLNALLGVADTASFTIAETVWNEVLDSANYNIVDSAGRRLRIIDDLTEVGGAGDLTDIRTQVRKIDKTANDSPAAAGSLAKKLDDLATVVADIDKQIVCSVNIQGSAIRIEAGVEKHGVMQTSPWVQCSCQIFDESNGIVTTVGIADFGAIGPRGFFTRTVTPHLLVAGKTYQIRIVITDGAAEQVITTKLVKVLNL